MRRSLALLLSSLIPLTGCASYTPSSAPIPTGADMLAWHAEGGLGVGADPYVDLEEQEAVFDVNLMAGGVLAVNILVQNDSDRQLLVRRTDIVLVLPDGTQLRPAGASQAASKMESGVGGVIGAAVAFGIIGLLVAQSARDKADTARHTDYMSKEFKDATLGKGESAYGFVYFIPPLGTPSFNEGTLKVRWVDTKEGTSTAIPVALTGLGYGGVSAKTKEETTLEMEKPEASGEASSPSESRPKGSPFWEDDPTTAPFRMSP